jgi:hypothetical protein
MTKDAKYSAIAFISGMVFLAVGVALELIGVDWVGLYRKWFEFVVWTLAVFGLLGLAYGRRLKKMRPLAVFLGLLLLHTVVFVLYLRSVNRLVDASFFILFPLEGGFISLVMATLGGTSLRGR